MKSKRILSGMQPSGQLHLGNYHGALKNWVTMQSSLDCFFFIADLHSLTTLYQDPQLIKKYSLSGEIKDTPLDYLMVVNTNIAGGKTDGVISQVIDLKTEVQEDGSVINNLTIKRTHNGDPKDYFQNFKIKNQ